MEKVPQKYSHQFNKVSFYAVAHADDWQLFMQPNVYNDLVEPGCKVVFIILTAGDAGKDKSFWNAREEGSKSSVRFCMAPFSKLIETAGERKFNGHAVNFWSANESTTYFLRLPDGNLDGTGFSTCNFQSISRLKSAQINSITSVDNDSTYYGWVEIISTLESIIFLESEGISNRHIHYLNPDIKMNPKDHTDHITTGLAIQAMSMITNVHQSLYVGYSIGSFHENLSLKDLFWKAGMFAVYEKTMYDICDYSTLKENTDTYVKWCLSKSNFIIKLPSVSVVPPEAGEL